MKWRRSLITAGLVVVVVAPAAAIVMPVIDVGPEQAIWSNQLVQQIVTATNQVQSVVNEGLQLKNEATNLSSVGNLAHQAISQNIGRITQNGRPEEVGDNAARQVLQQVPSDANALTNVDQKANGADGAQQQAQVSNLYLSTIAGASLKGNAMAAEEQSQRKNDTAAELSGLSDLFSGSASPAEQP